MQYLKMILFDYGHTLLYEPGWDFARGNAELLKYAVKNPNNCTLEDVVKGAKLIFGEHVENVRRIGYIKALIHQNFFARESAANEHRKPFTQKSK